MGSPIWDVSGWIELAALVQVLALPILLLSALIGVRQIKLQKDLSARESGLAAFLRFLAEERENFLLLSELRNRFEKGDTSVGRRSIEGYLKSYWGLAYAEWEYMRAGLLPVDLFASWANNYHQNANGAKTYHFYEADGQAGSIKSDVFFEIVAVQNYFADSKDFRDFVSGLAKLEPQRPELGEADPVLTKNVRQYVFRHAREYRRSSAWKLSA